MGTPIDLPDLVRATNRAVDAAVGDFLGERVALPRLSWALRPHTLLAQWATVLGLHPAEPDMPGTARYLGGWRAPMEGQLGQWPIAVCRRKSQRSDC